MPTWSSSSIQRVKHAEMHWGPECGTPPGVASVAKRCGDNVEVHPRHELSEGVCRSMPDVLVSDLPGQQPVHPSTGHADIAGCCGVPWLALRCKPLKRRFVCFEFFVIVFAEC